MVTNDASDFPNRLMFLIKRVGNASILSRKSGLSRAVIDKYRLSKSLPSLDRAQKLAHGGGVLVSWLVSGEGPMCDCDESYLDTPEIRERFRLLIELEPDMEGLSEKTGVPFEALTLYREGEKAPSQEHIERLLLHKRTPRRWLETGEGPMLLPQKTSQSDLAAAVAMPLPPDYDAGMPDTTRREPRRGLGPGDARDMVLVPPLRVAGVETSGPGAESDSLVGNLALRRSWVRRTMSVDPEKLAAFTISGDSMEPTIRSGDLLLVDTAVDKLEEDAIFVLVLNQSFVVKRAQILMDRGVVIKSDNPTYAEQRLTGGQAEMVQVAGLVRWIARLY